MVNKVIWSSYEFTSYTTNSSWNDVAGVYIFCGINAQNQWVPLYVGQAESFRDRFSSHEQWISAMRQGATHVHVRVVPQAAMRDVIERELIQAYQPRLNTQLRHSVVQC